MPLIIFLPDPPSLDLPDDGSELIFWSSFLLLKHQTRHEQKQRRPMSTTAVSALEGCNSGFFYSAGKPIAYFLRAHQNRKLRNARNATTPRFEKVYSCLLKSLALQVHGFINGLYGILGPVHTNPDIFENGGFFSRFRKNPRLHVAFSNRFCLSMTFDVIVFCCPHGSKNTQLRKSMVWRPFSKSSGFGYQKYPLRVDGSRIGRKKAPFSKISGYVWTVP